MTDMVLVRSWRNDYRIWQWCRQNDFISDADQARWFEAQSKDPSIKMYKVLVQVEGSDKATGVGVAGFTSIDMTNRRAEFSLYIAPSAQGNGLGKKALSCLLTHGFKNLGFNVIWGEVFAGNPALAKFEQLGFVHEGCRRDFYFRNGKFIDAHLISMRASEWEC
jgi:RimJ/RimL family protein N-acetyltransferase